MESGFAPRAPRNDRVKIDGLGDEPVSQMPRHSLSKDRKAMRSITTFVIIATMLSTHAAAADVKPLPEDASFCPSWAEAHERTLASLNNGRPPYKVQWKGCVRLKKGEKVDLVDV